VTTIWDTFVDFVVWWFTCDVTFWGTMLAMLVYVGVVCAVGQR
jgi:hypothetical protein